MAKRHDDFPQRVVRNLRERVDNTCSNPECRVSTLGPHSTEEKPVITGVAAHITAAQPGGPRYSSLLTSQERKSAGNGIWLCGSCAQMVDRDTDRYSILVLKGWKQTALVSAAANQNQRKLTSRDVIQTLVQALNPLPTSFIPSAIANVHSASAASLEALDSRLIVSTSFADGATTFSLRARSDPVRFAIKMAPSDPRGMFEKLQRHRGFGEEIEVDASAVSFTGSPLLEALAPPSNGGRLKMSSRKIDAVIKTWLVDTDGSTEERFENFDGEITVGEAGFQVKATACDSIVDLKFKVVFRSATEGIEAFNLGVNISRWDGQDLRSLPYFDASSRLFNCLAAGWTLRFEVEVKGQKILAARSTDLESNGEFGAFDLACHFLAAGAVLSKASGTTIHFKSGAKISIDDFKAVTSAARIAEGKEIYLSSQLVNDVSAIAQFNPEVDLSAIESMIAEPRLFAFKESEGSSVNILDQRIDLPPHVLELHNARMSLPSNWKSKRRGKSIRITFKRSAGFELRIRYPDPWPAAESAIPAG